MLLEILANRGELLERCRHKLAARFAPDPTPAVVEHGLPLFLDQLASVLQAERQTASRPSAIDPSSAIGRSAAMHGLELLRLGFTVDQVVHHYGDVCQAVAEMAIAKRASISADQFRTLNRCLDEAIAEAVTAFADQRATAALDQSIELHERLGALAEEQRRLIDVSLQTLAAIQNGQLAAKGATGTVLVKTMQELRNLVERTLPEIRLISGVTEPANDDWRKKRPG
ncbi:MAG TPA: hypothetical protein VEU32_05465 [Burkholderiales bacterium]|nr:hypothetical protein [Burkholderiales bacterium]